MTHTGTGTDGRTNIRCIPLIGFGRRRPSNPNPMFAEREMTIGVTGWGSGGESIPRPTGSDLPLSFPVTSRQIQRLHCHHHHPLSCVRVNDALRCLLTDQFQTIDAVENRGSDISTIGRFALCVAAPPSLNTDTAETATAPLRQFW